MNEYPSWIKDNFENVDKIGLLMTKLVSFFKDRHKNLAIVNLLNQNNSNKAVTIHTTSNNKTAMPVLFNQTLPNPIETPGGFITAAKMFGSNIKGKIPETEEASIQNTQLSSFEPTQSNVPVNETLQSQKPIGTENTGMKSLFDIINARAQILKRKPEHLSFISKKPKLTEEEEKKNSGFLNKFSQDYQVIENPLADKVSLFGSEAGNSSETSNRLLLGRVLIGNSLQRDSIGQFSSPNLQNLLVSSPNATSKKIIKIVEIDDNDNIDNESSCKEIWNGSKNELQAVINSLQIPQQPIENPQNIQIKDEMNESSNKSMIIIC